MAAESFSQIVPPLLGISVPRFPERFCDITWCIVCFKYIWFRSVHDQFYQYYERLTAHEYRVRDVLGSGESILF